MILLKAILCLWSLLLTSLFSEDAYEDLVGTNFVEETKFRFRTKFNRAFIDKPSDFKTIISHKVEVPPLLDGIMEDPCWKIADHSKSAFIQWMTKEPVRKQTVIYVCHDDENFYMSIVAEEPVTKAVKMLSNHPGGRRSWTTAGRGDHIETFIELGGVGGVGQVFQFIFNIYSNVRYDGLYPPFVTFIGTDYKLKGSFGAKRWICEMAFPHKGFNTDKTSKIDFRYKGPPRRGEVWGLRVVRDGPRPDRGGERMRTTWTYNPTSSWHIPYPTGIIVFEDRNALHNGSMNEVDPKTSRPRHWNLTKLGEAQAAFSFDESNGHATLAAEIKKEDEGVQVTQKIGVLPNVGYKLIAKLRKNEGEGTVVLGIDRPNLQHRFEKQGEWEEHVVDFFSDPGQREAAIFVRVMEKSASVSIDSIRVEQQIYGAPTGAVCLTGNSPREDLNLDPEEAAKVKYTYREPGTTKEEFPYRKQWTPGWIHGYPDEGGTTGWIEAAKGSLTKLGSERAMTQWSHPRPSAGFVPYPKGHELLFDLGKDYYIRSVELLPSGTISNMTVQVMPDGGKEYVLTRKLRGAGVINPSGPVLYGRLTRINSVSRYLKIWFNDGGHGVYFVRIWGEPKGDHKGISRFRWKEGLVVPEKKYRLFRKLKGPVLMPTPQEVEWKSGEFVVRDGIRVIYPNQGRGEKIARILAAEVEHDYGIKLQLSPEDGSETLVDAKGAIVLGDALSGGLGMKLAGARGWQLTSDRPGGQGYFLSSSPDGFLLCGYDQAGTFYGCMTLLQLLQRKDLKTAGAKSVEIRDWPYIPFRMVDCRGGITEPFVRALARMKVNYITGSGHPMLEDYFIYTNPPWAGHSGGSPSEMDDDENWHYLGRGLAGYMRVNTCPSHYQRYEFYDRAGWDAFSGSTLGGININTDEMDHTDGGSRWNADRRCLTRSMTGDELFTEMVVRAYDIFRLYNRKTSLLDTMMLGDSEGGNGSYNNMYLAYGQIPEDIHVFCWKGIVGDTNSDPEEAIRRFERATMLQSSFPLQNRGRLNEYYRPPQGKRVHGLWNTVWGAAGPVDQVLTGQFCRSMTMVDGGSNIPFQCQAWNPDSPSVHTEDWVMKIGHLQQRFAEIGLERELPSWRDGIRNEFFKVDMRNSCNWSHIDPVPGDKKDWLDWGPNNDLRHLPRGEVQLEEVPFQVIDPATNGGKSIIMVASQTKNARLKLPNDSAKIPVGRQASSLIFLRTNIGGGHLPGYRIRYEGGGYLTVPLGAMGNLSAGYSCYGLYEAGKPSRSPDNPNAFYHSAKHQMVEYYSLFFRLGWLGVTGCGDPVKATIHEWVNPYPEKTIESVSIHCPPGRSSGRLEVLFGVTGVVPNERDFVVWKDRKRLPLVTPNEIAIEPNDVPVIPADGTWEEEGEPKKNYLDKDGNKVCEVTGFSLTNYTSTFFQKLDTATLKSGGMIKLEKPVVCRKIAVRGQFYWEYHGPKVHYGVSMFRRLDYVLEISTDGSKWIEVGSKQGISGEDGAHVHPLPSIPIKFVRVKIRSNHYLHPRNRYASAAEGVTWLQLFQ